MQIINLTPHALNIQREDGTMLEVPASGQIARLAESREVLPSIGGLAVSRPQYGEITDLPEAEEGKIFVVSAMVLAQVKNRPDVFAPGEALRNEAGQIIGCKGLSAVPSAHSIEEAAKYWQAAFDWLAGQAGWPVNDPVDNLLNAGKFFTEERILKDLAQHHGPDEIARFQRIAQTTKSLLPEGQNV